MTIATQAAGVFGVGVEPPPDSTEPSPTGDLSGVAGDSAALGLRHLADLLLERHTAEQVRDAPFDRLASRDTRESRRRVRGAPTGL